MPPIRASPCVTVGPSRAGECPRRNAGKEHAMIVTDVSGLPLPGTQQEVIALDKELLAHWDTRWPLTTPRWVSVDLTGETGRVHILAVKASLAEHEQQMAEQGADAASQALLEQLGLLL